MGFFLEHYLLPSHIIRSKLLTDGGTTGAAVGAIVEKSKFIVDVHSDAFGGRLMTFDDFGVSDAVVLNCDELPWMAGVFGVF